MSAPEQLTLSLAHRPAQGREDFLVSPSNRVAFEAITQGAAGRRLALSGPAGAGKTHLASIWGEGSAAISVPATEISEQRMAQLLAAPAVVIEDADRLADLPGPARRQAEALVFHLFNVAVAGGSGLLITGRTPPARWAIETPDLASRLATLSHVAIEPPDDTLLSSVLDKLFADRQLQAGPGVIKYLVRRMERSFAAAEEIVERLDQRALAERRAITRPLAMQLFDERPGTEDEDI